MAPPSKAHPRPAVPVGTVAGGAALCFAEHPCRSRPAVPVGSAGAVHSRACDLSWIMQSAESTPMASSVQSGHQVLSVDILH